MANQTKSQPNFQNVLLSELKSKHIPCIVYLVNGFQLRGIVKAFDNFIVLLEDGERKQHMMYKHAISTIAPSQAVQLKGE